MYGHTILMVQACSDWEDGSRSSESRVRRSSCRRKGRLDGPSLGCRHRVTTVSARWVALNDRYEVEIKVGLWVRKSRGYNSEGSEIPGLHKFGRWLSFSDTRFDGKRRKLILTGIHGKKVK
ncbi:hypothetical protein V6N13_143139 [Hibiscus sabdariffa]|uniref:Uncharacterized protein n=1 Tax=Hibiscus sabdariffa TaxID=183260 RepID=A0ABR2FGH9_9ROSI